MPFLEMSNETKAISIWIALLLVIYIGITTVLGCESGWSIAGWDV